MSFDQVPGSIGYLVLNSEGAILSSGGDLENDERTASTFINLLSSATLGDFGEEVEKVSVNYADHAYVVTNSNKKIYIVKKVVAE